MLEFTDDIHFYRDEKEVISKRCLSLLVHECNRLYRIRIVFIRGTRRKDTHIDCKPER